MSEFVLYPDIDLCLGCKTCEIACAVEHSSEKTLISAVTERVKPHIDVVYVGIPIPMNCRHCEDSPCMKVCPTSAIFKKGDYVIIDQSRCIGCKSCAIVCPFGAIKFERVAYKCDECINRLEKNLLPACVEACPVNALKFERLEDVVKRKKLSSALGIFRAKEEEEEAKATTAPFRNLIWVR